MSIKKLNQDLINKIAAGEVVERPFSVIKELIENSIDAQATSIILEIRNGGIDYISLQDNGSGMSKEDAILSVERHATSKISSVEDLFKIYTMGFRGEALAAISSVSEFTLQTKQQGELSGIQIKTKNADLEVTDCACLDGTKVIVENLFYNVPARKKFLKSSANEYAHILELITNFALIYPQISFKLIHNKKEVVNFSTTDNWQDRIKQVLGEIEKQLLPIERKGTISINGFVGKPQVARNNRKSQYLFINNRIINDFLISKAVKEAFGTLIPRELYPAYVLKIDLPPELVDVNVHPQKAEVRFQAPNEIYLAVLAAVKNVLLKNDLTPSLDLISDKTVKENYESADDKGFIFKPKMVESNYNIKSYSQPSLSNIKSPVSQNQDALNFTRELLSNPDIKPTQVGNWRLLGQVHNSYLLVEAPNALLIIDQHAAAERIKYEKFKAEYDSSNIRIQKLLMPQTIELSAGEVAVLENALEYLIKLGFDIEVFGTNTFIVQGLPEDLVGLDILQTVMGIINDLQSNDFMQLKSVEDKKDLVIKYAACRSAVKFHDQLQLQEQIRLLKDIQAIYNTLNTCPHGRPFLVELSLEQLAKNFKR